MQKERREPMRTDHLCSGYPIEQQAGDLRQRRGPFSFAAGWLGNAFDRSRVDKREAEERRSRNM